MQGEQTLRDLKQSMQKQVMIEQCLNDSEERIIGLNKENSTLKVLSNSHILCRSTIVGWSGSSVTLHHTAWLLWCCIRVPVTLKSVLTCGICISLDTDCSCLSYC